VNGRIEAGPALYVAAFSVPLVVTLIVTPIAARVARRWGVLDAPGGHKVHAVAVPYLGGIAVAVGLLLVGSLAAGASGQLVVVLAGALVLACVGLLDDVWTVSPWIRLAYEVVAGVSLWAAGIRAGVFETPWLDLPVTVVWVVAVTNAFNFIDNMDGIAAGVAAASALGIAAIAGRNGDYLVTSMALAVAGAAIGFLRYNLPPARIFLGDAGSMLLGFLVASLILKLDLPVGPWPPRVLTTVLLAGVALFDLTVVVAARLRDGRPVWSGGTDHTSHRLVARGHPRARVIVVATGAQLGCSALAFGLYPRSTTIAVAALLCLIAAWLVLLWAFLRMPLLLDVVDPASGSGG